MAVEAASAPLPGRRRRRPTPTRPPLPLRRLPRRRGRFVGALQAVGLVLPPRSSPAASSVTHMSPPQTPIRMVCEACLTDWVHLSVLAQLWTVVTRNIVVLGRDVWRDGEAQMLKSGLNSVNQYEPHNKQPEQQKSPKEQEGQQANGLPLDGTNPVPFRFPLEQHRLQLDQVLQLYNEQVQVLLQQEMSIQNLTQLNLRTTNALIQKVEEVASLHVELQRRQERMEAARQLVVMLLEIEGSIRRPPMQQEMNSHVSFNQLDAPGSGDEATSEVRTAAETTKIDLICQFCNFSHACMLLLPCQHLCACKLCEARLAACPVCGAVKGGAVEARFVEK